MRHLLVHAPDLIDLPHSCASMSPECNFDDGDCAPVVSMAADSAKQPCDRSTCKYNLQDGTESECYSACFVASCDFSGFRCAPVKEGLRACPAFDAAALVSYEASPDLNFPDPSSIRGSVQQPAGSFRGFGRCALGCRPPVQGSREPEFQEAVITARRVLPSVSLLGRLGASQDCQSCASEYACTCAPALPWAWAAGSSRLTLRRDVITVQLSLRIDPGKSLPGRLVVISSETFGIGVAPSGGGHPPILSLRAGSPGYADLESCGLRAGDWHHVVISFRRSPEAVGPWTPAVYINGSQMSLNGWAAQPSSIPLSFTLDGGLAVGRDFPTPEYLTRIEPEAKILADDGSAYFTGAVAALRLWAEDGAAALGFNTTCSEASSLGGSGERMGGSGQRMWGSGQIEN